MEFDPIETCPYDKIHRIRRSRMQFHIRTCSKNFLDSDKMQCPYDARHKVNKDDFESHVDHCPSRESIIDYPFDDTTQAHQIILPINVKPVKMSNAERWDEEADLQTYSPLEAIQDKPIVYAIIGLSRAKRRKHRMQERMRYNQNIENNGNQIPMQSNSLPENSGEDEQEEKPLRRPHHIGNKVNGAPQNKNQNPMPSKVMKTQLPPVKTIDTKEDKKEYTLLPQPHNIDNKGNSAVDKNENLISKNSRKLLPKINKTSNAPLNHTIVQTKNEEKSVLNKSKDKDIIIDKLSKKVEEIALGDKSHKKKTEQLDKEINEWKVVSSKKKTKPMRKQN